MKWSGAKHQPKCDQFISKETLFKNHPINSNRCFASVHESKSSAIFCVKDNEWRKKKIQETKAKVSLKNYRCLWSHSMFYVHLKRRKIKKWEKVVERWNFTRKVKQIFFFGHKKEIESGQRHCTTKKTKTSRWICARKVPSIEDVMQKSNYLLCIWTSTFVMLTSVFLYHDGFCEQSLKLLIFTKRTCRQTIERS